MATVHNSALANQVVGSRWGDLKFDAKGNCDVSDEMGLEIHGSAIKGFQVMGLPVPEEEGSSLDDETLDDSEMPSSIKKKSSTPAKKAGK